MPEMATLCSHLWFMLNFVNHLLCCWSKPLLSHTTRTFVLLRHNDIKGLPSQRFDPLVWGPLMRGVLCFFDGFSFLSLFFPIIEWCVFFSQHVWLPQNVGSNRNAIELLPWIVSSSVSILQALLCRLLFVHLVGYERRS